MHCLPRPVNDNLRRTTCRRVGNYHWYEYPPCQTTQALSSPLSSPLLFLSLARVDVNRTIASNTNQSDIRGRTNTQVCTPANTLDACTITFGLLRLISLLYLPGQPTRYWGRGIQFVFGAFSTVASRKFPVTARRVQRGQDHSSNRRCLNEGSACRNSTGRGFPHTGRRLFRE